MLYRVKQFKEAVFASLTQDDLDFVNKHLDDYDRNLFLKLSDDEKKHSINVARDVIESYNGNYENIVRAALLHDIGKINGKLNPISKGCIVMLNRMFPKVVKKMLWIKPINTYYNHAEIGYKMYVDRDEEIANIIRHHHNYDINNCEINVIQLCDCRN